MFCTNWTTKSQNDMKTVETMETKVLIVSKSTYLLIDQFWYYIKIQPQTIDLSMRLWE